MKNNILNNGLIVPGLGFGTYKATTGDSKHVLEDAIKTGYRYLDTASFYQNEEEVGMVLKESEIPREEFRIATKVWKTEMGYESTKEAIANSLRRLQTDYLDVYLIHWPKADLVDSKWEKKIVETWRAMEELYEAGKLKAIGVSNFLPHHLQVVLENGRIKPCVDQIEFHPGYLQMETIAFCQEQDILIQAWSPLGRAKLLQEVLILELAKKYRKSVAQVCLRFIIQMGVMPLPKASSVERMQQNQDVFDFEISAEDMERIKNMPQSGWSGEHPDRERVIL